MSLFVFHIAKETLITQRHFKSYITQANDKTDRNDLITFPAHTFHLVVSTNVLFHFNENVYFA